MKNGEHPSSGYDFDFAGGTNNTYTFTTINAIKYAVTFVPTFYLFEGESSLEKETFEMIIEVSDKSRPVSFDSLTGLTIAAIIGNFYQRSPLTTTLFICDDADRRELARHRKFRFWFSAYNERKKQFAKFDFEWKDKAAKTIYISVIILSGNPYAQQIQERFNLLATDFRQDK